MVLNLTFACSDYDRMKAIEDGRVTPEGISLTFLNYRPEETFFRQLQYQEFDLSECSLSSYVLTLNEPNPPFIAIPVFPSRMFRHQSIYINTNSGIKKPEDLRGKRVGTPEYNMTAGVWQRGALQDDYGVEPESMEWFQGAVEYSPEPRHEKLKFTLPENLRLSTIPAGKNLSQMLAEGELDAVFSATQPSAYNQHSHVQRLFPNFKAVEQDYFSRTGILPIMHVVVIKRSIYEKTPWVARTLQKAFAASMEYAYQAVEDRGALRYILPWLEDHLQETRRVMGGQNGRYWQDGFKENRHVIDKFLEYSYRQGLAKKRHQPEDLFASNCLESFVV